jgi:SAM-dependent methyltransferase
MDKTEALIALLDILKAEPYAFVPPTPATHKIVAARRREARVLRDVLGWSLPFRPEVLSRHVLAALRAADGVEDRGGWLRSRLRVASLGEDLFLHSAFPTEGDDAVFFGPDSYRFARFILQHLDDRPIGSLVDIGAGSGVGAVVAARRTRPARALMTEINPKAVALARANARAAGVEAEFVECEGLQGLDGPFDLVIANPPFIADPKGRAYRDGGGLHGAGLSLDWAREAMPKLAPGGRLLLYTGAAVVEGRNALFEALEGEIGEGFALELEEIDPDIFGEEMNKPEYADVERIAAVGAVISRRR